MTPGEIRRLAPAVLVAMVASGCGGGANTDSNNPPPPLTRSGQVVIDGPIRNALVCLDLNNNGFCDPGEPASARTGADGSYSLSFDGRLPGVAVASLIAPMVPGSLNAASTTVDMAHPTTASTTQAYVLRQVPGKGGQISPLTTLLVAGMAAGMTEAQARFNAALQLAVSEAKLDNYQDDPAFDVQRVQDNARTMAKEVAAALEKGVALEVGDQLAAKPASLPDLRHLNFNDASNHFHREWQGQAVTVGTNGSRQFDRRFGRSGGTPLTHDQLYGLAYLTTAGWVLCDDTVPIQSTVGVPHRSNYCLGGEHSMALRTDSNIADRPMKEVVAGVVASGSALFGFPSGTSALGEIRFPAGSTLRKGHALRLTQSWFINNAYNVNAEALPQDTATRLEQVVAALPAAAVDLRDGAGTLALSPLSNGRQLRLAFAGSGTAVQYYECEPGGAHSGNMCNTAGTGHYVIDTVNGSRVMRFTGHGATGQSQEWAWAEVKASGQFNTVTPTGDWIYQVRRYLPGLADNLDTNSHRINPTAWQAMKVQLGL